jgi:pSer/pThr/pTyr-binding forkhead associated (FHA) protein
VFCPSCGFRNREGDSFCARCGASLIQDQDEAQTTVSYEPGEDTAEAPPTREALPQGASLVIRSGGGRAGETYPLVADRVSVGRHPDSTIFLDDVTVSRNHAVVERDGTDWYIVDKGSLNGTYVNRRRVERHLLSDGDELQIGKYKLTFIVQ